MQGREGWMVRITTSSGFARIGDRRTDQRLCSYVRHPLKLRGPEFQVDGTATA